MVGAPSDQPTHVAVSGGLGRVSRARTQVCAARRAAKGARAKEAREIERATGTSSELCTRTPREGARSKEPRRKDCMLLPTRTLASTDVRPYTHSPLLANAELHARHDYVYSHAHELASVCAQDCS
eukprot:1643024-Pleurochrysis_carterae.AAC.2